MNTRAKKAEGWKSLSLTEYLAELPRGFNPFSIIGDEWMLIGAGTAEDWNAMTASWGGLGVLWNHTVATCYVRPTRHTFSYMERSERFTLSFLGAGHRKALNYFGSHSGRDGDKAVKGGLSPICFEDGTVSFAEARFVFSCRKLYAQDLNPSSFIDPSLEQNYPEKDYHRMYVGEIERVWRG